MLDLMVWGYVKFSCSEEQSTALFEAFRQIGFSPKALERDEKKGEIRFSCGLRAAGRLRQCTKLTLTEMGRGGLPTWGRALLGRPGLVCGIFLAITIAVAARLFVWDVDIIGNESISHEELLSELAAAGLSYGCFLPGVDGDSVSLALLQGDHRIAYASVNLRGTVAYVQIREAVERSASPTEPADVIAARDGVVTLPMAYAGECLVRAGDVVRAGQVLISGALDSEKQDTRLTRASGQILARTTHTYRVTVPFSYEEKQYTGEEGLELALHFFGFCGNFFKTTGNIMGKYDIIINDYLQCLSTGRRLPVWLSSARYREYECIEVTRTAKEALAIAKDELAAQIAAYGGGRIVLERTEELQADADGITLICTLICEEDIAKTAEPVLVPNS